MSEKGSVGNGNSPAYPQPATPAGYRAEWATGSGGLTKREEFARSAQAAMIGNAGLLQDITAACKSKGKDDHYHRVIAEIALDHADALLIALEKEVDNDR